MAEQLVQEYLDRAQVAEQTILQLKIQLQATRAGKASEDEAAVAQDGYIITELNKQLSKQKKKISELEKTVEDTKGRAPSDLVAELKGMLKAGEVCCASVTYPTQKPLVSLSCNRKFQTYADDR
ncbi:hypothetical protein LTR15_000358 [Elasticomyces elasticus]|nr:hypothetical protein LTR15_000358 [Elasticomyces elasticus]